MTVSRVFAAAIFCLAVASSANATTISLTVAGTSDPWLAGAALGTTASSGDTTANQSPAQVTGLGFGAGDVLTFGVEGAVSNTPACPCDGPDGSYVISHYAGAENGVANVTLPLNSLLGVFLTNTTPVAGTEHIGLNFGNDGIGTNFKTLAPGLQQVFFIGDGRTDGNLVQEFIVPVGATRLFLGTMDGWGWFSNVGEFHVDVTLVQNVIESVNPDVPAAVPEPTTMLLLGTGLLGVARMRKKI